MRKLNSFGLATSALVAAALAPPLASADQVYHTEHLALAPVGGAPLRSGFVQNIKANGPVVYAHEIFVLNGARPRSAYTVTRSFFPFDKRCSGKNGVFASQVADLQTNASGNAKADVFVRPADVAGFEGVHGVMWTVRIAGGGIAYQTVCTKVTLD
jgi:hypothetical protein